MRRRWASPARSPSTPSQIEIVNEAFTPSPDVADAARSIDAFAVHEADGRSSFLFDGQMVEPPTSPAPAAARAGITA